MPKSTSRGIPEKVWSRKKTGINCPLKLGYNKVFGYYIEVTNVPIRRKFRGKVLYPQTGPWSTPRAPISLRKAQRSRRKRFLSAEERHRSAGSPSVLNNCVTRITEIMQIRIYDIAQAIAALECDLQGLAEIAVAGPCLLQAGRWIMSDFGWIIRWRPAPGS